MLEIKPCTHTKELAEYCRKCGKIPDEAFYLYVAEDKGKRLAACLFEVESGGVRVLLYECEDESDYWLFDGMLRAGFNYAWEQGITAGFIPERFRIKHQRFFAKLNYPAQPEFDITNFFQKYKNCK